MMRESGLCTWWNRPIDTYILSVVQYKTYVRYRGKGEEDMDWTFADILEAFKEYIEESEYIDVCHSKFGYVILHYNPGTGDFAYTPEIIESPEELLQCLKEEIVMDVLQDTEHDLEDATEEELKEIETLTRKYMDMLEKNRP